MTMKPQAQASAEAKQHAVELAADKAWRAVERRSDGAQNALSAAYAISGRDHLQEGAELSAFEACLRPLLEAMNWPGEPRRVIEALPHFDPIESEAMFAEVLRRIGFHVNERREVLANVPDERFPFVFIAQDQPRVALGRTPEGALKIYDGAAQAEVVFYPPQAALKVMFVADHDEDEAKEAQADASGWFMRRIVRFSPELRFVLLMTLLANVAALATPLFSMVVYNTVVPTKSLDTLAYLLLIIFAALAFEYYLRSLRSKALSATAAQLNAELGRDALAQVLSLPAALTYGAPVGSQMVRLRQFESVLGVFTGNLAVAVLDLPFTILFIIVIGVIGGPLILAPLGLAAVFAVLGMTLLPYARRTIKALGRSKVTAQNILQETVSKADVIHDLRGEDIWRKRALRSLRRSASDKFHAAMLDQLLHAITGFLTMAAGVLTAYLGATMVMSGDLSMGAMIAAMMLVWRVLSPIQAAFLALNRIVAARDSVKQINALMRLPTERSLETPPTIFRSFKGRLALSGVSYRQPGGQEFTLKGLSAEIPAGQHVAIAGPQGSGKSTALRMLLRLHEPTSGSVFIDGLNIAQLDLGELRASVGYVEYEPKFFYGTLAQNFRLAHPMATDDEIANLLHELRISLDKRFFADGLNTRLTPLVLRSLTENTRNRLFLARALIKPAPILLLPQPPGGEDEEGEAALIDHLKKRRGQTTVLVASNRLNILKEMDRVMVMREGRLAADGPAQQVLEANAKAVAAAQPD